MREINAFKIVNEASVLIPSVMMASMQSGWLNAKGPKTLLTFANQASLFCLLANSLNLMFFFHSILKLKQNTDESLMIFIKIIKLK